LVKFWQHNLKIKNISKSLNITPNSNNNSNPPPNSLPIIFHFISSTSHSVNIFAQISLSTSKSRFFTSPIFSRSISILLFFPNIHSYAIYHRLIWKKPRKKNNSCTIKINKERVRNKKKRKKFRDPKKVQKKIITVPTIASWQTMSAKCVEWRRNGKSEMKKR